MNEIILNLDLYKYFDIIVYMRISRAFLFFFISLLMWRRPMTATNISLRKITATTFFALSFYSFSLAQARIDAILNAPNFLKTVPTMQLLGWEMIAATATGTLLIKLLYDFIKDKEYRKDEYNELITDNIISCK